MAYITMVDKFYRYTERELNLVGWSQLYFQESEKQNQLTNNLNLITIS